MTVSPTFKTGSKAMEGFIWRHTSRGRRWHIGAQAIAKAAEMHPDLVFIDIKLEGEINGIEAIKHIRSSLDIPTIYLADYSNRIHLYRIQGIIVVFSLSRGYLRVSPLGSNKGYRDVYAKIL